jgi:hypothetical protein
MSAELNGTLLTAPPTLLLLLLLLELPAPPPPPPLPTPTLLLGLLLLLLLELLLLELLELLLLELLELILLVLKLVAGPGSARQSMGRAAAGRGARGLTELASPAAAGAMLPPLTLSPPPTPTTSAE